MRVFMTAVTVLALGVGTQVAWAQDCSARLEDARGAVKQAEAAMGKAKDIGKKAASGPLAKAKKILLHAEAECKTAGSDIRKLAESGREAREAQGLAEEAAALAEKL